MSLRGRTRDAAALVPAGLGAAGLGVLAAASPLAAAGVAAFVALCLLPWLGLVIALCMSAILQSHFLAPVSGIDVGGLTARPEQLVLAAFALKTFVVDRDRPRGPWGAPEWLLLGFIAVQPLATLLHSPNFRISFPAVGLLAFGALAYLTVATSVGTRRRAVLAARVFLAVVLVNALYGLVAELSHVVFHTNFGMSAPKEFGAGVVGLSYEHDIFASTCAAGAVAFYCLWRERNEVFPGWLSGLAFIACSLAMVFGLARGAWIGFGVGMFLVVVIPGRRLWRPGRFERVAVVFVLLAAMALTAGTILRLAQASGTRLSGIAAKFDEIVNFQSGTGRARLGELQTAVSDIDRSPIIGLGTATYDQRHPLKRDTNYIGNVWLRALYDTGLVGLVLLASFAVALLWPGRRLMWSRSTLAPVARALVFGWIVLAVAYAATDNTLFQWPWILLGLVRATRRIVEREDRAMMLRAAHPTPEGAHEPSAAPAAGIRS